MNFLEAEVVMCLQKAQSLSKSELLEAYNKSYSIIEKEASTQKLMSIYKKFQIVGKGHKLPQLHKRLNEQYLHCQDNDIFFSEIGLNHIYPNFPRHGFSKGIDNLIDLDNSEYK